MKTNEWARLLAYVTGLVNQQLLLRNEYLAAENRILRAAAQATAADRFAEMYVVRNRKTARPKGAGASCVRGKTGHDSGVAPTTDRAEV